MSAELVVAPGNGLGALLRQDGFRRLATGQLVSGIGDWMVTLALMVLVLDVSDSSTAVGGVLVLRLLPTLVAGPIVAAPRRPLGSTIDDAGNGRRARRCRSCHPLRRHAVVDLRVGGRARTGRSDLRPGSRRSGARPCSARLSADGQRCDAGCVVRHDPRRCVVLRACVMGSRWRRPRRRVRRRRRDVRRVVLVHRQSAFGRWGRPGGCRREWTFRRRIAVADRACRGTRRPRHSARPGNPVLDGRSVRPGRARCLDAPVRCARRPVRGRRGGRPGDPRRRSSRRPPGRPLVRRRPGRRRCGDEPGCRRSLLRSPAP